MYESNRCVNSTTLFFSIFSLSFLFLPLSSITHTLPLSLCTHDAQLSRPPLPKSRTPPSLCHPHEPRTPMLASNFLAKTRACSKVGFSFLNHSIWLRNEEVMTIWKICRNTCKTLFLASFSDSCELFWPTTSNQGSRPPPLDSPRG